MRRLAPLALLLAIAVVVAWWATRDMANAPSENERPVDSRDGVSVPTPLAPGAARADAGRERGAATDRAAGSASATPAVSAPKFSGAVTGVVSETGGGPIAKARVVIALAAGDEIEHVIGETDGGGRYTVTIHTLEPMSGDRRRGLEIQAGAVANGHRASWRHMDVPAIADGPIVVDLTLDRGASIRGRVLAQDGSPATNVWMMLCDGSTLVLTQIRAEKDGRFAMPITSRKTVRVVAEGRGASEGVAESNPITVDPDLDVELPDLRLVGSGVLEGRATYPDGSPARYLVINAEATEGEWKGYTSLGCASAADGSPGKQGRSDGEGRFRLAGLKPGRFLLSALGEHRGAEQHPEDVHETGDAGSKFIKLVVNQHRVLVRVRDEAGRPAIGLSYDAKASGGENENWSMSAAGIISPGDSAQSFDDLPPGATFAIDVEDGGLEGHGEIVVPQDAWETTLDIVAKKASPRARLRVVAVDETGKPLPYFVVASVHKEGGISVMTMTMYSSKDGPLSPPLAPGPYDLTITPGSTEAPEKAAAPSYFSESARVNLVGGVTKDVRVVARRGGALRVTFRAPEGVELRHPTVRLVPSTGGEALPIESVWIDPDGRGLWTNDVKPDVAQTYARALPSGRYTLVVEVSGLRASPVPVDITAGAVADAIVVLLKD